MKLKKLKWVTFSTILIQNHKSTCLSLIPVIEISSMFSLFGLLVYFCIQFLLWTAGFGLGLFLLPGGGVWLILEEREHLWFGEVWTLFVDSFTWSGLVWDPEVEISFIFLLIDFYLHSSRWYLHYSCVWDDGSSGMDAFPDCLIHLHHQQRKHWTL